MTDHSKRQSIDDFSKKLAQRRGQAPKEAQTNQVSDEKERPGKQSAMGTAFRLSTDLVAAVLVGGFVGWLIDKGLGTEPFGLLIFFFLGVAAGIVNVFRTARQLNLEWADDEAEGEDKSRRNPPGW
ncbi:MAG: AtpZ/AtpI family protein [Alphaproteobacteria bacterium]